MSAVTSTAPEAPGVGALLRLWRERRRFSQQELSNRSSVSTRHLSRLETGRAHPTPEMLLRLSDHLDVPIRERDRLLLAAGFAPRHPDRSLDDADLAVVLDGVRRLLDAHLPHPALLLDDRWDVVDANAAVDALLVGCAPRLLEPPVNVVRLCLDAEGLAPRIRNLAQWAAHLHDQVRHRADRTHDAFLDGLAAEIAAALPAGGHHPSTSGPVVTLDLAIGAGTARFFSTTARLTTATDAALEGLHLETFLPADEWTRQQYRG
ncbi:helix-turn-helix domain-containing protein [Nakamurella leprariae]|uniref:Helix-turn-helix domain-containing protein n=1 Tax=Nakamurella leprariae TaxID=2803911 RepID=A0A938YBV5_9ACTN|nr:helix-turn-helix domain-containing protein [Nakamurella leprariae]MBM9466969.1 helix-turn-helix domain-containing protein [Nakamurella leprariae]